jgi:hypothetical protein
LSHTIIVPWPGFSHVGLPALVIEEEDREKLLGGGQGTFTYSGWVDFYAPSISVPSSEPPMTDALAFLREIRSKIEASTSIGMKSLLDG